MIPDDNHDDAGSLGRLVTASLAAAGALALVLAVGSYIAYFGSLPIVADSAAWGRFGDFVGGILTPLVGLLAVLGILWSMRLMRCELARTCRAVERLAQSPAVPQPETRSPTEPSDCDDVCRTLGLIHEDLKQQLAGRLCIVRRSDGLEITEVPSLQALPKGARELQISQLLRESVQDPILREALAGQQRNGLLQIAEVLQLLARYLLDYEVGVPGGTAGMYFRRRYAVPAVALHKAGVLPDKVVAFYRDYKNGKGRAASDQPRPGTDI